MNDFDFLTGTWHITNRRLRRWLVGADEWDEFPGISHASRHFAGAANFDEIEFPTLGTNGLTLRLYDPAAEQWSLYWASSRDGALQPPVRGRWVDGRGEFFGDDVFEGRAVRVRYRWSVGADTARWEQAFCVDGEQTWETNWIMDLARP